MAKKQDSLYFNSFIKCTDFSCQAAHMLEETMADFDVEKMADRMEAIHTIEHSADKKRHSMTDQLAHAFITPIEREDISALSARIDTLTDKLEEVCIRVYMHNVQTIHPGALNMLDVVIRACDQVCRLLEEFADFKHSKKLKEDIIRINSLEEECDRLYIANMRNLHVNKVDIAEVIAWGEIYTYLEKCADACEAIADSVEYVVMKNS